MMKYTSIKLHGGPSDGRWVRYGTPLPKTLVVPQFNDTKTVLSFNDYQRRKPGGIDYYYVPKKIECDRFQYEEMKEAVEHMQPGLLESLGMKEL
jgi:hypothetical protein